MMPAPADSPKSVTRSGSPPNAAMLSRTQRSAASTSRKPRFVSNRRRVESNSDRSRNPSATDPIVHGDDDRFAVGGQHPTVVERLARRADDVGAAVHPHHHRLAVAGRGVRRRPDVEGQAVLILRRAEVDRDSRVDGLRADEAVAACVGDGGPRLRRAAAPATSGRRPAERRTARPSTTSRDRRRTPRTGPLTVSTRVLSRVISGPRLPAVAG